MTPIRYFDVKSIIDDLFPEPNTMPIIKLTQNAKLHWFSSDVEEQYRKKGHPFYGPEDITYEFNEHGFRSSSFLSRKKKNILFVGCSRTFCVGVDTADTLPVKLTDKLGKHLEEEWGSWSIAYPAMGTDFICRVLPYALDFLRPDWVFLQYPPLYRREFIEEDGTYMRILIADRPKLYPRSQRYVLNALLDLANDTNETADLISRARLIERTVRSYGIGLSYTFTQQGVCEHILSKLDQNSFLGKFVPDLDKARDNGHAGPKSISEFCDEVAPEMAKIMKNAYQSGWNCTR